MKELNFRVSQLLNYRITQLLHSHYWSNARCYYSYGSFVICYSLIVQKRAENEKKVDHKKMGSCAQRHKSPNIQWNGRISQHSHILQNVRMFLYYWDLCKSPNLPPLHHIRLRRTFQNLEILQVFLGFSKHGSLEYGTKGTRSDFCRSPYF